MNNYLTREIWKMRKPLIGGKEGTPLVSLFHVNKNNYQLLFLSRGCDKACTFCNYGYDFDLSLESVKPELKHIVIPDDIFELELEANGSFLSEREIPYDLFLEVLRFVANKQIPLITMESHYTTITEQKLQDIRRILGDDQSISFELGFESSDSNVRAVYNKDIDNDEFVQVASLCYQYGIELQVNVLLGAPFMTREEQIQDCLSTLDFIFENLPQNTLAVVFPINIKSHTMLKRWQDEGLYEQISAWELVELLHRVPVEYLDKLTIAWWGNRENAFKAGTIQHPATCVDCKEKLMKFFSDFYCNHDPAFRKAITTEIWNVRCSCDK